MPRFAPPPGTTARQPRGRRAVRLDDHPSLPPGKVAFTRGPGTFHARDALKELRGRWEPDLLGGCWLIPVEHADEAEATIREAERNNPDNAPSERAGVGELPVRCYVCGGRYTPSQWRQLRHAVREDWYCGCADREKGPPPRIAQVRR